MTTTGRACRLAFGLARHPPEGAFVARFDRQVGDGGSLLHVVDGDERDVRGGGVALSALAGPLGGQSMRTRTLVSPAS